jgi:hypothetical protein
MGYTAGDKATLKLTVVPNDVTTAVVLELVHPDGTTTNPGVDGGPQDWQAIVDLPDAGLYVATWTVTGTGVGQEQHRVAVAPNGPVATVWASTTDLANWLQAAPPTDADRLLARAAELVNSRVVAPYLMDDQELPTEARVIAALRDACCAQVEQWISVGEDNDVDGYDDDTSVSAGSVGVNRRPLKLAPRARAILREAGLLRTVAW